MEKVIDILLHKIDSWVHEAIANLPNVIVAILIVVVFIFIAGFMQKISKHALERFSQNSTLNDLIATIVWSVCLLVGLFIALGVLNLEKTVASLLTGAGIITLVLGFAFQDIASNFFSGIIIAFKKPYQVGDIIEVEKNIGSVEKIELRSTIIKAFDGSDVLLPNKNILTQVLTNYTLTPYRRVDLKVGVAYDSDLKKVEQAVKSALEKVSLRIKEKPVEFYFYEFADSSINFDCYFWINYRETLGLQRARHEAIVAINEAFKQNSINIPYPITTVLMPSKSQ